MSIRSNALRVGGSIGAAVLLFWVLLTVYAFHIASVARQDLADFKAYHNQFVADIREKTDQALMINARRNAEVIAEQDKIRQEQNGVFISQIALGRSDSAAYFKRLLAHPATPGNSAPGGGGTASSPGSGGSGPAPGVSSLTDASGRPVSTSSATLLDDLNICSDNTVNSEQWQAWWVRVSAAPR